MFAAVHTAGLPVENFVQMQTVNARKLFGLAVPEIKEGEMACITLFNPGAAFTYTEGMIRSRSKNSAFPGKELKGTVLGIINKGQIQLNQ